MSRARSLTAALVLAGSLLLSSCALGPADDIAVVEAPIVDGTFESGHPEVVFLYNLRGAACTASIISPYVVLTANHCVDVGGSTGAPSGFRVYVGSSTRQLTTEYLVSEVRPVPNAGLDGRAPNDVALLVLSTPATETPLDLYRGPPTNLWNVETTAIGYGQTPTGGSGTKYTTTMRVNGVEGGFYFVEPSVCSGDSGGPLLTPEGTVAGVASFIFSPDGRTRPECGTAPGAYNEIFRHLDFIDMVLEETGSCIPNGDEVCNGEDDNCDGEVDEGCIAIGQPCATSDECVGGLCAETAIGRVCTSPCDMLRPDQGCSPGFYCSAMGCDGFCVPGEPGTLPYGSACSADTDCDSLHCRDPGDGMQRCLDTCEHDSGLCLGGEVCAALPGGCGSCVSQEIFAGRGLGEPCDTDAQCGENRVCLDVAGVRECAGLCEADDTCPELFTCRDGLCIRDRTQGVGGVCDVSADCGDAICATAGERSWCTAECSSADDCPTGFDCVMAGPTQVCAPSTSLDGESCVTNADCASGICATGGAGAFCTQPCDARNACAPGFICQRTGAMSSQAVCVRPPEPVDEGDCSASPGRARSAAIPGGLLGLLLLGLALRRRRD